jgi:hypothetical protein
MNTKMNTRTSLASLIFVLTISLPSLSEAAGKLAKKHKARLKEQVIEKVSTSSRVKGWVKSGLKFVPGGNSIAAVLDEADGGGTDEKVDRIDKRSKKQVEQLREQKGQLKKVSQNMLKVKTIWEEIHYAKQKSKQEAAWLSEGLKKATLKNFVGAVGEEVLEIPLNPAEYIPSSNPELKKKLEWDLSHEKGFVRANKYLISGTRSALLDSDMMYSDPDKFDQEYEKAETYDKHVTEAVEAQETAMARWRVAEINRLKQEIKALKEAEKKSEVTKVELLMINQAKNAAKKTIFDLQKEVNEQIKKGIELDEEEQLKIAWHKAQYQRKKRLNSRTERKKEIKKDYAHLSFF